MFCILSRTVIAALSTPVRRITIAIMLSAGVHAALLWLPPLHFQHEKVSLPILTVRLESLPKTVNQRAAKPQPVSPASKPGGNTASKAINNIEDSLKEMEKSKTTRQYPKHVQLTFVTYGDSETFRIGELRHQLDIVSDRYTLTATRQSTGLTTLLNSNTMIQTSRGKISDEGLQPEIFEEEKIVEGTRHTRKTTFNWAAHSLSFTQGPESTLPADTQDSLSFMYQLSQYLQSPIHREFFTLPISDETQLEQTRIEIGNTEDLNTPMGTVRALHLRKMHAQGEAYFEIWLGLEYRLLPVKIRHVDSSEKMTGEFLISDIRAADE